MSVDRAAAGLPTSIPIFCQKEIDNVAGSAASDLMAMSGWDATYLVLERQARRQETLKEAGDPFAPDWDPLYGEPFQVTVDKDVVKTWNFREGVSIKIVLNSIEDATSASPKGQQTISTVEGVISRFEADARGFRPQEGDVIRIPNFEGSGFPAVFEVNQARPNNWVGNTGQHVGWDVTLTRLEKYVPERRLEG